MNDPIDSVPGKNNSSVHSMVCQLGHTITIIMSYKNSTATIKIKSVVT